MMMKGYYAMMITNQAHHYVGAITRLVVEAMNKRCQYEMNEAMNISR